MRSFDASPRSATVKAIGETRVLVIEHEGLLKKIKMDPTLAFRIIKQMSQRIRDLNSRLSAAQRTINQANNILQQLNKNKDISIEDLDTNLHSE